MAYNLNVITMNAAAAAAASAFTAGAVVETLICD